MGYDRSTNEARASEVSNQAVFRSSWPANSEIAGLRWFDQGDSESRVGWCFVGFIEGLLVFVFHAGPTNQPGNESAGQVD